MDDLIVTFLRARLDEQEFSDWHERNVVPKFFVNEHDAAILRAAGASEWAFAASPPVPKEVRDA